MTETKYTFCRICEALCGLKVTLENGEITQIRPDDDHVATQGFACAKGLKQQHLYTSPDRLQYPLKRVNGEYQRISWEQALSEIGAKVKKIRQTLSPDSIAMYVGTAAGFGVLHPVFAQGFMTGLGSKSMYASATQDCSNKFAVARHVYGFPFTQPFPDVKNTHCLIIVGANPVISKWSFLQVPNPGQHLREIEKRGGKVFIIDPRRTETAKVAGEHVFIRPNTDVFFYLSFLNEVIASQKLDYQYINEFTSGFAQVAKLVKEWTPEKTAEVTTIAPEKLREIVQHYLQAEGAALYCSTGVNMGTNGSLAFWLQECINAITGNLDKIGGTLVGKGVMDFIKFGVKKGVLMRNDKSRIGNFTSVNDAFPGGILADEILTEGDKQVKALFVTGGNPLITMANSQRLKEAFEKLELLVVLDILPTETASIAHYILPCTSPLQRPDLPFIFPLMLGLQAKPYLQATQAIVPPEGEQRDEASIYLDLARACGTHIFGSPWAQRFFELTKFTRRKKSKTEQPAVAQEFLLNGLLKLTKQKGFRTLLQAPHGILRPAHQAGSFLGKRIFTEDGKVNLAPEILMAQAKKLASDFELEKQNLGKFKLISKRAVTTHNSWTHNYEEFVDGGNHTNYLYINPLDAQKLDLKEYDLADVSSETATVRVPVKFNADLMLGTVALPHGWGHQHSLQQVANQTKGVNINILVADGPDKIEKVSGMANLSGFVVEIKKSTEAQKHTWSGI
ncbi:MAG: molybdopterin-dependent oxidoreductase [Microscillaceae bacterium]|jgi:formate dehydrogenase|nr:molybdopterin-dependent oxidoreductase [Microscillaceae bacterium]